MHVDHLTLLHHFLILKTDTSLKIRFSCIPRGSLIIMAELKTDPMSYGPSSRSANTKCHILIIGCGLGGLAAAIAISKVGHEVTILEKRAELEEVDYDTIGNRPSSKTDIL